MCNFLNLFCRVKVGPFLFRLFLYSEEILHCSGECVQPAGRKHEAHAVMGEEMQSPALFSTPCWQQLATAMPAARIMSLYVCTKPVPQLADAGSCSDARLSARSRDRCLIIPADHKHYGDFFLGGEQVHEEGSICRCSWTQTPSVAMPASAECCLCSSPQESLTQEAMGRN